VRSCHSAQSMQDSLNATYGLGHCLATRNGVLLKDKYYQKSWRIRIYVGLKPGVDGSLTLPGSEHFQNRY